MSIIIDGTPVQLGDTLYSRRAGASGKVTQVLDSAVVLTITRESGPRNFTVTGNGVIAGSRDVYWHQAIEIPLPKHEGAKHAKILAVIAALIQVL